MRFSIRDLLLLTALVGVDCVVWTVAPPIVRTPAMVAVFVVVPGFAWITISLWR